MECYFTLYLHCLQGGSIMKGWMKNENEMITCCSDGTRPVIFKIE
ncbi:MAG: TIGR04076 family protein [Veillonella sp.]|nr:TIGR04076 family protein [Veillonella sp.]